MAVRVADAVGWVAAAEIPGFTVGIFVGGGDPCASASVAYGRTSIAAQTARVLWEREYVMGFGEGALRNRLG